MAIRACSRYGRDYAREARAWLEGIALLAMDDPVLDEASSLNRRASPAGGDSVRSYALLAGQNMILTTKNYYILPIVNDVSTTHRTTIDIEVPAFEEARDVLGTKGYKETVNEALRVVSRREQLRRGAERIRSGALGLTTPEELEELRRSRA